MASLVVGMFIIAFFSIIFYLIKPTAFFTINRQSISRLRIISYLTLYLIALLVLIGMVTSEDDSSFSLLGFFLGITIQILLCTFISKKNNIKTIKNVVHPNLPVMYSPNSQETYPVNMTGKLLTEVTSLTDTPIVIEPVSESIVQTTIQSAGEIIAPKDEVFEHCNIFINEEKQLDYSAQEIFEQKEICEERQRLISMLKTALLLLKQQREFEEKKDLKFRRAKNQVQILIEPVSESTVQTTIQSAGEIIAPKDEVFEHCNIFINEEKQLDYSAQEIFEQKEICEERQRLISILKTALLLLKRQREFQEKKDLKFRQAKNQVQNLVNEDKASFKDEIYILNFESKINTQDSALGMVQNEENFSTFQLEPKNNVNEKIIPLASEISQQTSEFWVSSNKKVEINGLTIPDGMFYLGTKKQSIFFNNEPSFIDIRLPISSHKVDIAERLMGYWPSYSQISPEARRAYLDWLAEGRSNPKADIGYVFLFFYGLERRALIDAQTDLQAKQEIPDIIKEVVRLLSIYGSNGSFKGYASRFVDYVSFDAPLAKSYLEQPPKVFGISYELPLSYRIALGQLVIDKYPLPVDWALAWVLIDRNISKRTPVTRCVDYFKILFKKNYKKTYGDGFILSPNRTKLKITYFPASSAIPRDLSKNINDLPDVSVSVR